MNRIICVVGMTGSGKSRVADQLVRRGFQFIRFGQITLDIVKEKGLEPTEENEKVIREDLRREHGMGAYATLNIPKFDALLEQSNVVADGLYSWSEYKILKDHYKEKMTVLAVVAPAGIRYGRLEARTDIDEKMRNRPASKEQARSRDFSEIENIEKGGPIAMADYYLINNSTFEDLIKEVNHFLDWLKMSRPSWDEYFMGIVKAVAERGTCNRGKTGVVIVKDKRILTTGYVGSPIGLDHCDDVGHLMKKVTHEDGTESQHCLRTNHAEINAICQAAKSGIAIDGSTLYCKLAPCETCAKAVINVGIKRIVAQKRYHGDKHSLEMFKQAGVEFKVIIDEVETYANM